MEDGFTNDETIETYGLSDKQRAFCQEYIKDFVGCRAAVRAGYAEKASRVTACHYLADERFQKYIKSLLDEAGLSKEATLKMISDMARGSLNDYFITRTVEHTPKVRKPVADLIKELEAVIEFEEEYASEAELNDQELTIHAAQQSLRKKTVVRYRLLLKRNPNAAEIVDGETELIEVPELDMAKLVADKELGRIKSITPGQYGTKVEMYSAETALTNLAKIHGLFEKDNERKLEHTGKNGAPLQAPVIFMSAKDLTPEQIEAYLYGDRTNDESL